MREVEGARRLGEPSFQRNDGALRLHTFVTVLGLSLVAPPRPARLLHPFDWGGSLLSLGVPVAIDARNDCTPARIREEFLAIDRSEAALRAFVRRYAIDGALVPDGSKMDRGLRRLGFWPLRRRGSAVLLVRAGI